jgi:RNA recognition motif-containing protein
MEGSYNSLGLRMKRTLRDRPANELLTLKDFIAKKFMIHDEDELKRIFVKDLKNILQKENLFDLIQGFFELETDLSHAYERLEFESSLVNFDEFYKNLSPVLMRSLLENANQPDNAGMILKSIKEALRIALEEELVQLEDLGAEL